LPSLRVPCETYTHLVAHLEQQAPREGCGLLVSASDGLRWEPLPNVSCDDRRFEASGDALVTRLLAVDEAGERLVAIVHSHPRGPAGPSAEDLSAWAYGDVLMGVVSLTPPPARLRAFRISAGAPAEVRVETRSPEAE
jgi:proteasome lid subunit RPN8/RPN11